MTNSTDIFACGVGLAATNAQGEPLDCLFPSPLLQPKAEALAIAKTT